jgi:hypothetical protein
MRSLILITMGLLLSHCAVSPYSTQCKRNPAVDGSLIGVMAFIPLSVVATTPIGLGAGAIMGGSYYVTHDAVCSTN